MFLLLGFLLVTGTLQSQNKYLNGDILFLDLDCGELCDAIESVHTGYDSLRFSHVGMVYLMSDSVYIIEAIGEKVQLSRLSTFLNRSKKPALHMRLKENYRNLIPAAIDYALQQINTPYDFAFIYNNGKYYCSELIYDAFRIANGYEPVFDLEYMNFKLKGTNDFDPVWVKYYKKLDMAIPQNEPGINPNGMSRSEKMEEMSK